MEGTGRAATNRTVGYCRAETNHRVALLVMVACGIFGIPVAKHLSAGGFQDPTSESAQATQLLVDKFGQGDMQLLISVTSDDGAQSTVGPLRRDRHRRPVEGIAVRRAGDVRMDRARAR